MKTIAEVLEFAQDVYEERRYHEGFDWRAAVNELVSSNVFTGAQAAQIVGVTKQYVQKYLREQNGATGKRTRGGVAGKFNPDSLMQIRMVQAKTLNREARTTLGNDVKERIKEILDEGTGASLLAHLTALPVVTVREVGRASKNS